MKSKFAILGLACVAALLGACTKQPAREETIARAYFDKVLRNEWVPYRIGGISGYTVRNYELVSASNGLAVVKITYASKTGTDIVKTKRYMVDAQGELRPLERDDIDEGIRANLARMLLLANEEHGFASKLKGGRLLYADLSDAALKRVASLRPQAGEDYRTAELETGGGTDAFARVRVKTADLRTIEVTIEEAPLLEIAFN